MGSFFYGMTGRKLLILACLLYHPTMSFAAETDQFTLPPEPLGDIGPELEIKFRKAITDAIMDLRRRLHFFLEDKVYNSLTDYAKEKILTRFQDPSALADAVYLTLGGHGLFSTDFEYWLETHEFEVENPRFYPGFWHSIYWSWPAYFAMSSTINVFGVECGTDKLGHFIQQGYGYYQVARNLKRQDADEQTVHDKVVEHGVFQERTYFGRMVTAGFSRADLAANYAGYMFYRNLTEALDIPGMEEPIAQKLYFDRHGQEFFVWELNSHRDQILEPFMTDHLNEATNPSSFSRTLKKRFKPEILKRCEAWKTAHPDWTRDSVWALHESLTTWYDHDYGHPGHFKGTLSLAKLCWE